MNARIPKEETEPLIGRVVDRYEIQQLIGAGAMGLVFRARHTVLRREYALKVLTRQAAANPDIMERFRREAQVLSELQHENLVCVYDFGTDPSGLTFLVMELVPGRTLAQVIEKEGNFSFRRAAKIARQIAAGLAAAHSRGFVHRDIKPSNIMITPSTVGDEGVKILDFGIAGSRSPRATSPKLTVVHSTLGTATYMAPEQALDPNVGPAADLYSLGVVLYEMLTGVAPFHDLSRKCSEKPPRLPRAGGLEQIVDVLLEIAPHARIQSAEALVFALDRLLVDMPDGRLEMDAGLVEAAAVARVDAKSLITLADRPAAIESHPQKALVQHGGAQVVALKSRPEELSSWSKGRAGVSPAVFAAIALSAAGVLVAFPFRPQITEATPAAETAAEQTEAPAASADLCVLAVEDEISAASPAQLELKPPRKDPVADEQMLQAKLDKILERHGLVASDLLFIDSTREGAEALIGARRSGRRPQIETALRSLIASIEHTAPGQYRRGISANSLSRVIDNHGTP